jgi:hypothetical protein
MSFIAAAISAGTKLASRAGVDIQRQGRASTSNAPAAAAPKTMA